MYSYSLFKKTLFLTLSFVYQYTKGWASDENASELCYTGHCEGIASSGFEWKHYEVAQVYSS